MKKKQNNPFFLGELERLALTLLDVFIGGFFSQCFSVRRFFSLNVFENIENNFEIFF